MKYSLIKLAVVLLLTYSCNTVEQSNTMSEENWKLGWRMIENSRDQNLSLAEMQFDSIVTSKQPISERILLRGLVLKANLSKEAEVIKILSDQPKHLQHKICENGIISSLDFCSKQSVEIVENKKLELELIKMFVADQAVRSNLETNLIPKYDLDINNIVTEGKFKIEGKYRERLKEKLADNGFSDEELEILNNFVDKQGDDIFTMDDLVLKHNIDGSRFKAISMGLVDEQNRDRLKEIINEYGFPTEKLIGKEAMHGVWAIIQHADGDKDWQKSMLPYVELGVSNGEFSKNDYAYLYDRIQVNHGLPQRYGSQFEKVDRLNKIAELRETEDLKNLDNRRREMDMMPIELYKQYMLSNK